MGKIRNLVNSKVAFLLVGLLIGATVFGGTATLASNRDTTMNISYRDIKIVVDGVEFTPKDVNGVYVEPFVSNGTTYLPVRAVATALGKEVGWDGDTATVYIGQQPTKPTEPITSSSVKDRITITDFDGGIKGIVTKGDAIPGKLANGTDITEANITAMLAELEAIFPDGTSWGDGTNGTLYKHMSEIATGGGCTSWAGMTADLLWGKGAKYSTHGDLTKVKAGDVVLLKDANDVECHWFVVRGTGVEPVGGWPIIYTCDGNVNGKVSWSERATNYTASSYPNSVIYTFYS